MVRCSRSNSTLKADLRQSFILARCYRGDDVNKTDFDIIQSNIENLKKYIESVTLKSINVQMDEKCVYCPFMFEYKCRKSSCMFDDCQNSNNA